MSRGKTYDARFQRRVPKVGSGSSTRAETKEQFSTIVSWPTLKTIDRPCFPIRSDLAKGQRGACRRDVESAAFLASRVASPKSMPRDCAFHAVSAGRGFVCARRFEPDSFPLTSLIRLMTPYTYETPFHELHANSSW